MNSQSCKICGSNRLVIYAHTAKCERCGVLLCYPYPRNDDDIFESGDNRDGINSDEENKRIKLEWHLNSEARNHHNFTNMTLFAMEGQSFKQNLKVLDYGGGGGQFAVVLKSIYPLTKTSIVDICDAKLLDQFASMNEQIKFKDFSKNPKKFDYIFMNDVFEHVSNPEQILSSLKKKLDGPNSKIFIDTPCQFWLYPFTKLFSNSIHTKLLRGTVDYDHQQIWSKESFNHVIREAGFKVIKYLELSEFTQPAEFYLDNMKIKNFFIRFIGKIFLKMAPYIAKNKIMAVLSISDDVKS